LCRRSSHGSADIFRVRVNGMGLERLTDHPAYDDQAALSPDGSALAFVSTRDGGSTDIYVLDLKTRKARRSEPLMLRVGRWFANGRCLQALGLESADGSTNLSLRQPLDHRLQGRIPLPLDVVQPGNRNAGLLELLIRPSRIHGLVLSSIADEQHPIL
jgi:WD40 repeat protein